MSRDNRLAPPSTKKLGSTSRPPITCPKTKSTLILVNGVSRCPDRPTHMNSRSADHFRISKRAPPNNAPLIELLVLPEGPGVLGGRDGRDGRVTLAPNTGAHANAG